MRKLPFIATLAAVAVLSGAPAMAGVNVDGTRLVDRTIVEDIGVPPTTTERVRHGSPVQFAWGGYTYCGWFTNGAAPHIRRSGGKVTDLVNWPMDEATFRCITVE
jgi:hypothetical protein